MTWPAASIRQCNGIKVTVLYTVQSLGPMHKEAHKKLSDVREQERLCFQRVNCAEGDNEALGVRFHFLEELRIPGRVGEKC